MKRGIQKIVALLIVATMSVAFVACKKDAPTAAFNVVEGITLVEGASYQITPADVKNIDKFNYASVDEDIVTVSDGGLVTAVAPGSAEVVVEGKGITKNIKFTVKLNEINGLHAKKLDAIAAYPIEKSEIGNDDEGLNFGWGADYGEEHLNNKVDFSGTATDSDIVLRASHSVDRFSAVDNGVYVAALIAGINPELTTATVPEGVHASYYAKMEVSARANHFRLWGWSNQDDVVSGKGSFRIAAYVKEGNGYKAIALNARDKGTLEQSADGWITFDSAVGTVIKNGPADNMFIFDTKTEGYDIKGKTVVMAVEFRAVANTLGAEGKNLQSRFGIKRMGFILDPAPNFTVTSSAEVILPVEGTSQITTTVEGEMSADDFTYVSGNTAIASVSAAGLITAVKLGETTITIKNQDKEKTVAVKVVSEQFNLPTTQNIVAGGTASTYKIVPSDVVGVDTFAYESTAPFIATVAADGTVTAKSAGVCEIKVTGSSENGGSLVKNMTVNVAAVNVLGVDNTKLKNITALTKEEITIGDTQKFNFGWGANLDVDPSQFSADDSAAVTVKALRGVNPAGGFTALNKETNYINMITNINAEIPATYPHAAIYSKVTVPELANFRVWAFSPAEDATVSGKGMFRVVFYLPNADYTQFTAFNPEYNFQESADKATKLGGGYTKFSGGIDCFFAYTVPAEIQGKEVIMSIETMGLTDVGTKQTRFAVKRIGFTA